MGVLKRLFGKNSSEPPAPPPGIVVELARWEVTRLPDGPPTILRYGETSTGEYVTEMLGDDEGLKEFVQYYLDDPLDGHPIYIHGLGPQKGPHTRTPEQFDRAMHELPIRHRAFEARPIDEE